MALLNALEYHFAVFRVGSNIQAEQIAQFEVVDWRAFHSREIFVSATLSVRDNIQESST